MLLNLQDVTTHQYKQMLSVAFSTSTVSIYLLFIIYITINQKIFKQNMTVNTKLKVKIVVASINYCIKIKYCEK